MSKETKNLTANSLPWEKYKTVVEVQARWRDLDALNHVTNSVYFNYFEEARIAFFRELDMFAASDAGPKKYASLTSNLVRTGMEFRAAAYLGQKLLVCVRVSAIKKVFLDTEYEIFNKDSGKLIATGWAVNVLIDTVAGRMVSVPKEMIAKIEEWEGRKF